MADSRKWWNRSRDPAVLPDPIFESNSSLQAAASPVLSPVSRQSISQSTKHWQRRVLELCDLVPEPAGAGGLVRNSVDLVQFIVESKGSTKSDIARAQGYIDYLDYGRAAQLIWVTGEIYVILPKDQPPQILSISEFRPAIRSDEPNMILVGNDWVPLTDPWFRIWKPSLNNRMFAISPHKATLDLLEAMYVHQLADTAVATSRLAGAGILVWPTNLKSVPLRDDGTPSPGSQQEMLKEFQHAAWSSISKRTSKEAHIPFVVFVDADNPVQMPQLLHIERKDHADQYHTRFVTYRERYASAVDLPIEAVTGTGKTNHWSAWAVNEEKWKSYLAPLVELIRKGIEQNIVKQMLGPGAILDTDPTDLLIQPDQTATLLRLLQLGKIETSYALEQLGYDPSKATEPPPQQKYATQQMDGIPASMQGGSRGGGQPPQ